MKKVSFSERRKTSKVWNYFKDTGDRHRVKCALCERECSIAGGSTGNLMRHIKLKHPKVQMEINANESHDAANEIAKELNKSPDESVHAILEIQCSDSSDTPKAEIEVETSHEEEESMSYYLMEPIDANRGREIDKQLLRIIVKELHPFSIIEDQEFITFVSMLNPNYTLPSHKMLSDDLLPQVCQSTMEELKSALEDVTAVALTTDRWTSINNENFIAVTAHYLNKNLELKSSMLDCISFSQKHNSNNIAIFLQEVVANWGLSDKIVAVVTDNAACMVEAVKECEWEHIPCFAHLLNSIAKAGLAEIKSVISKVRNIVEHFKRNSVTMSRFCTYQNEADIQTIKLKKDSPMRWNSTFDMITRFLKNKDPVLSTIEDLQLNSFEISPSEWIILEKAVKLLIPFNGVTVELCSEKNVPLSKVPHMTRFMTKHVANILEQDLPPEVIKMGNTMKKELINHLKNVETNDVICQSVLLDPRLKKRGFQENAIQEAYSSLQRKIISLKREKIIETNVVPPKQAETQENAKQSEYFIDMWSEFRESKPQPEQNLIPAATVEIDAFLSEAYIDMKDNHITYWTNILNQSKFPTLFELVKKRLCVPATCIPCENIFSKAGNALLEKRHFMISGKLKEVLFLHKNL